MGAPVYNTNFVGSGTRTPKPVLAAKQGGSFIDDAYTKYKRIEDQGGKVAEIGTGLYGAYRAARAAYPTARAGLQALLA